MAKIKNGPVIKINLHNLRTDVDASVPRLAIWYGTDQGVDKDSFIVEVAVSNDKRHKELCASIGRRGVYMILPPIFSHELAFGFASYNPNSNPCQVIYGLQAPRRNEQTTVSLQDTQAIANIAAMAMKYVVMADQEELSRLPVNDAGKQILTPNNWSGKIDTQSIEFNGRPAIMTKDV